MIVAAGRRVAAVCCIALAVASRAAAGDVTAPASATEITAEPITPIPPPPPADPQKVALGRALFADPRLSHGRNLSCQSCHDLASNGADGRRFDAPPGQPANAVNTSTVFNAALSYRLTWQASYETLEQQAAATIAAPEIMGSSLEEVAGRLAQDPGTRRRFEAAYGHAPDADSLLDAIATYERGLVTPDSRFDRWLRGETTALTAQEREGYEDFKAYGCVSCHQGVNVGGNLKQRSGVFRPLTANQSPLLRVPSLRNIATTAPYFHDGSAPTLRVAVGRMARAQLDRTLSEQQLDAVVAFLRTLTGQYDGRPVIAPP